MIVRKRHGFSARFKGFGNEVSLRYVNSSEACYPNETRVGQGTKSEACVTTSQLIVPPPTITTVVAPARRGIDWLKVGLGTAAAGVAAMLFFSFRRSR